MTTRLLCQVTLVLVLLAPAAVRAQEDLDPFIDAPRIAPFFKADLGVGVVRASCVDCELGYGGFGLGGAAGGGVVFAGRVWIGGEFSGVSPIFGGSRNTASMRLVTLGVTTAPRVHLRAGFGTARYSLESARLVDDRPAGMLGFDVERTGDRPHTLYFELAGTLPGSTEPRVGAEERYTLFTLRAGIVSRFVWER